MAMVGGKTAAGSGGEAAGTGRPLFAQDFRQLVAGGWGDPENNRAQALAWFGGRLYVGVSRHGRGRRHPGRQRLQRPQDSNRSSPDRYWDQRGEIWRYDPGAGQWERAFVSPAGTAANGRPTARDSGYRRLLVTAGSSGPPTLYATTISAGGSRVLRSSDGSDFVEVSRPPGAATSWSYRAFLERRGRLYLAPAGSVHGQRIERNRADAAILYESADLGASWRPVSPSGFGDARNRTVYELAEFQGHLYAGTFNPQRGFQVWKGHGKGGQPRWTKIVDDGALQGKERQAAASMCVFKGRLYVGTGRQGRPSPGEDRTSPAEIIRIDPDDSWELVMGEPRAVRGRALAPVSGYGAGFDNPYIGLIWRLVEHDGWLYAGTEKTAAFGLSIWKLLVPTDRRRIQRRLDRRLEEEGGFELWRSLDGNRWEPVTRNGFGSPSSFGVESMLSTPAGLFVGTVSLPAIHDGVSDDPMWQTGCEVWHGA